MFFKRILIKIISLNFKNYKYIGLFSVIIGLIIAILFFEYFFIEENFVYAMKKIKLIADDFFSKDKYNYGKKFTYKSIYGLDLERYSAIKTTHINLTCLNNNNKLSSYIPFSHLDIASYKSNFSTFNNNRILNSVGVAVDLKFNMTLEYLKNHLYFLDTEIIKSHLLPLLEKSQFCGDLCESFKLGLKEHPWLVVYDNISNKWLVGICTHAKDFAMCREFGCGIESFTTIIADIDFDGIVRHQRLRTFIVFEDIEINKKISDIVINNNININFFNKNNLNMNIVLEMINSNSFNYIIKNGQIFFVSDNKGFFLKCCLDFKSLLKE